jgi:tetratricopeptide (TPR) repeat protein
VKLVITASRHGWLMLAFLLHAMLSGITKAQTAGEIIDRKGNDAQEFKVETNLDHTNGPALAPEAELSLEDLRALLHLYSRLDRPRMVEVVAGRILRRDPRDKETLQLLASFYLERKDAPRALKHARALVRFYPDDAQARFQLAMAFKVDGQYRAAMDVLMKLKSEKFQTRLFPHEAELASAALLSGDWPQAVRSYQETLENPKLRPEDRSEARKQLEELYRTHLPQLFLKETFTHSQSGLIFRSLLDWSQPLSATHRLRLELERDDLKLNEADLLKPQWTDRYDALVGVESDFRQWRTKLFGGFGDEGAIYGAGLTRVLGPDEDLTLAFHGNQRATDSLLLEVLHGREDELSLLWNARFFPDVVANVKLRGRRVLVDGETLGYGYGVDLHLERVVLEGVPQLHLGYRGLITGFSQSSENIRLVASVAAPGTSDADRLLLLNNLVTPINLHGLYLSWQQTINPEWNWHVIAGSDYSFTRSSFGQTFEAGLSYFPSRRTEVILGAGYSTSASTSDQDPERLEVSVAFRCRF